MQAVQNVISSIKETVNKSTANMATDYKFEGWMGLDKNAIGNMQWKAYEPKPFNDDDVDIQITHSGICGSDLHTLRSGWGATDYPCVVGHEIVGRAVRVGPKAEGGIKVGDRVGVGAQSASCLQPDCEQCSNGEENHCMKPGQADTYNSKFKDGSKAYGGYANYWRGPSHFVIKVPDGLSSEAAAPMMCGGVTTYAPLKDNGAGPGKRVGIVGVGGLGHFGILWAKALGCEKITAISRNSTKKADALKMGATDFIATDEDENWDQKNAMTLDLIVCTVSSPKLPVASYLSLLGIGGRFVQVGAPEDTIPGFNVFALIFKKASFHGSKIGPPHQIAEMLKLAVDKNVQAWIQKRPMEEANQAIVDMDEGKARYRYTLINQKFAEALNT